MAQTQRSAMRVRRISLSLRVSLILVLAAVLPLVITVSIILGISRPALIEQANRVMSADTQNKAKLIDDYFDQRVVQIETLTQRQEIQDYLEDPNTAIQLNVYNSLSRVNSQSYGSLYNNTSLLDRDGRCLLSAPSKPTARNNTCIIDALRQEMLVDQKPKISSVFFDTGSGEAYVDIYAPIIVSGATHGYIRLTCDIHYIWQLVNGENNANGEGTYGFILDENGVRIAYTSRVENDPDHPWPELLMKPVSQLTNEQSRLVQNEKLYNKGATSDLLQDDGLHNALETMPSTFTTVPAEKTESYVVAAQKLNRIPWTYFVLSPESEVTNVATRQLYLTIAITVVVLAIAGLVGFVMGRQISLPIMQSVDALRSSSESLKGLATKELSAASEQMWVVEASEVGLHKVEYYSSATSLAAKRLNEMGSDLMTNWDRIERNQAARSVNEIMNTALYIERARTFQDDSNKSLAAAIRVTSQVAEQLTAGANAASEAADNLEGVVNRLRDVVGQ